MKSIIQMPTNSTDYDLSTGQVPLLKILEPKLETCKGQHSPMLRKTFQFGVLDQKSGEYDEKSRMLKFQYDR